MRNPKALSGCLGKMRLYTRWWFQIFFVFTPIWGRWSNLTFIFFTRVVHPPISTPCVIQIHFWGSKCFDLKLLKESFRSTPHPVTVTTRIITFLVGNPYKPSFATVTGWGGRSKESFLWVGSMKINIFGRLPVVFLGCVASPGCGPYPRIPVTTQNYDMFE